MVVARSANGLLINIIVMSPAKLTADWTSPGVVPAVKTIADYQRTTHGGVPLADSTVNLKALNVNGMYWIRAV